MSGLPPYEDEEGDVFKSVAVPDARQRSTQEDDRSVQDPLKDVVKDTNVDTKNDSLNEEVKASLVHDVAREVANIVGIEELRSRVIRLGRDSGTEE